MVNPPPPFSLFEGPVTPRVPGETTALWACVLAAPATIALASIFFPGLSLSEFLLLVVAGLAFVSISRGRLIGSSIRIDARQIPELFEIATHTAERLGMTTPQIFVRDDPFVPITAVGVGEPYALIISSQYYEHLRRGELAFLIARELGHIAAGHTRIASLLSASGRENPVVAVVFGAWLRRTEYTADRVGLLCSPSIEDALGAISISTYHSIGRRVDMRAIGEQRRDLQADASLRFGEWTASMPYATNRLEALARFASDPLSRVLHDRVEGFAPPAVRDPDGANGGQIVARIDCASLPRRVAAFAIDLLVVGAILKTPIFSNIQASSLKAANDPDAHHIVKMLADHLALVSMGAGTILTLGAFFIYSAILVGLSGQTLGMMVMELRVVTTRFARPSIVQSTWRYAAAFGSTLCAIALLGFFMRVHPHDRVSRTRVVRGRRTLVR